MAEPDPKATLPAMLAHSVAIRGGNDAVVMAGETLSYDDLDRRTARMARALLAIGAGKGTRIALLAPDGIPWLTTFFAGMRIGAIVATVSTLATPSELAHILRHSDCQILIGARRFLRHDYARKLAAGLPGLADGKAEALRLPGAPYLRSIWLDDPDGLGWARSIDDLNARADAPDAPDATLLAEIEKEVVPSDDAVIIYTSGSTSLPKAVVHSQRSLATHTRVLAEQFVMDDRTRVMSLLPLFWIGGLTGAIEVLSVGGSLVYPDSPETEAALDTIQRFGVNQVNNWGPQHGRLREAAVARGIDVERINGYAPPRDKLGTIIPPHRRATLLGMTESLGPHSCEPFDTALPEDKAGAAGRATGDYERRAIDPETDEEVELGKVGVLQLRGGALMTGFYKADRRDVFTRDGFYQTDDLVSFDKDGYLYFHGRQGDMLKTGGANVSRLEVQAALNGLPEVDLPIVVGLPDPEAGQLVVAAVVPTDGAHPTEQSLRAQLRETLASYKIPRRIVFLSSHDVQWTPSNKIKLAEMSALIAERIADTPAATVD